ncbi:MAG: MgtC/SapB family protein [Clostridia bacterium]|nr:MgtC/SapB family protein [Clostridia bacterium]
MSAFHLLMGENQSLVIQTILRALAAVFIGGLIGSERARHGRAAGMRTHILVCLGACMTAMTSMFVADYLGHEGDVFRISAQVISGIGFLGAGMIILKSNNVIMGLTTAAGVWTTGTIGVALGYGYFIGALVVTVLFLVTIILFAKFERRKKRAEIIYIEVDDLYKINEILKTLEQTIPEPFTTQIFAPKTNRDGHAGINLILEKHVNFDVTRLCEIENIVFAVEE